jgi:hypothetical protein
MKLRVPILLVSLLVLLAGCPEKKSADDQSITPPAATDTKSVESEPEAITANTLYAAGHAKLFNAKLKEIPGDAKTLDALQEAILAEVSKDEKLRQLDASDPAIQRVNKFLQLDNLPPEEAFALKAGKIERMLAGASEQVRLKYDWRNRAILSHRWNHDQRIVAQLRPEILELLRDLGVYRPRPGTTDYMRDCRAHDVPIPPDWAETGTAWVLQGTLMTNLLSPGSYAAVWTYSDPVKRGACIALPRGDGSPGSPSGIICQSATTGHVCFWDNILRSDPMERFIGWSGQTLRIADLKDGSNLNSPCTNCHIGNNVYLISPDDPTWGRVLRGPLDPPRTGTFTTRVESSTDVRDGHPRYIPITTLPPRARWENTFPGPCCAGACHEQPVNSFGPPLMPPACAVGGDVNRCYGTP